MQASHANAFQPLKASIHDQPFFVVATAPKITVLGHSLDALLISSLTRVTGGLPADNSLTVEAVGTLALMSLTTLR